MKIFQQFRRQGGRRRAPVTRPSTADGSRPAVQDILGYPLQTKLTVGAPDDEHERQADAVAERVMRMPAQTSSDPEEEKRKQSAAQGEQGQTKKKEEETVQAKSFSFAINGAGLTTDTAERIQGHRGGGSTLPVNEQAFFESRLGSDLGGVHIHADAEAARLSTALSARAFTVGKDIFFGSGEYRPGTTSGRRLLAHELAHVLQQSGAKAAERQTSNRQTAVPSGRGTVPRHGTSPAAEVSSSATVPKIMRSVIFSSTIDIRYRYLRSRDFSISKGSIRVTADAGYPNPATCGSGGYNMELREKGTLWDSSHGSRHFPNGTSATRSWSGLPTGETYYLIITVPNAPMNPNVCALVGNITVEE